MNAVSIAVALAYLLAAAGFVVALHLMNSPATARRGSRLSWLGMIVAVAAIWRLAHAARQVPRARRVAAIFAQHRTGQVMR